MVPLYESKMAHHFDHRFATFEYEIARPPPGKALPGPSLAQKQDPNYSISPWYWVPEPAVSTALAGAGWYNPWLIGWRDITKSDDVRTLISGVIPAYAAGDTFLLLFPIGIDSSFSAGLLGNLSSLVCDYIARQKVGGLHLKAHVFKQLPVLPPATYTAPILAFLIPRILELTYTANDMRPWAEDLGYTGPPFVWDEDRRAHLRAELDAAYAHLYGLTRDELRYILDPTDVYGPDFPSETFRVLKEKEIRLFGEYRTARLVLAAWDRFTADGTFVGWAAAEALPTHAPATRNSIRQTDGIPSSTPPPAAPAPDTLPDGAWERHDPDMRRDTGPLLAALVKALPGPTPIRTVRRAALLALEPHRLLPHLTAAEAATWLRLIGAEAAPRTGNVASFAPTADTPWGEAVRLLLANRHLIEDRHAGTWAPGTGLDRFETAGWPDGRARFVLNVLARVRDTEIDAALPDERREWVNVQAA